MNRHWAYSYIGQEWVAGVNDCWAFFRQVQLEQFGRVVPAVDVDAMSRLACTRALEGHDERSHWQPVSMPQEGDAVLLGKGRHPSHIGLWAASGVLHCIEHAGVIHQPLHALPLAGWNTIEFYRHL